MEYWTIARCSTAVKFLIELRARRDYSRCALAPPGSPCGRSTPLRGVVELGLLSVGGSKKRFPIFAFA
jgi:hypothetical protein